MGSLLDTSTSLLDALRSGSDDQAWRRLVDLYGPLFRGWLKRHGAAPHDADDVVQDVLAVVVRKLPEFELQPRTGAFRAWLKAITVNCLRDHWRRWQRQPTAAGGSEYGQMIAQLEDPHSSLSQAWDREHDQHVTQFLLRQIRPEFSEKQWRAFERFALDGLSADEVARELNTTANAVFIAKSRVMSRLRRQGQGLLE